MRYRSQLAVFMFGFLVLCLIGTRISSANQDTAGDRHRVVEVSVTQYVWQVVSRSSGKTLCEIIIEYDREPTQDETVAVCSQAYLPTPSGTTAANATPQPNPVILDPQSFLNSIVYKLVDTRQFTHMVTIPMQEMTLGIHVLDSHNGAELYVLLSAYEPEPEYQIEEIRGKINTTTFACAASSCRLPIVQDSQVEFWAISSFGDESEHITAILRVIRENGSPSLELSSMYPYKAFVDSCAQTWESHDYIAPEWARFPLTPSGLNTGKNLHYLAGRLINAGMVDAKTCPGGGLMGDGSPNGCGMEQAREEMTAWQNQYDIMIWSSGRKYGIPPILIKSILEYESQFWPTNLRRFLDEFGLAQINQWGADVALRWDNDLYKEVCSSILSECDLPYASLSPPLQAILRGGMIRTINADCPDCTHGIDYTRTVKSIPIITRVIRSNCEQANFIMKDRGAQASYEDMWKFTMVSYHSGYYCLDEGIRRTRYKQQAATWKNFTANLETSTCKGTVEYIDGMWELLNSFKTFLVTAEVSGADSPIVGIVPRPTPTLAPTAVLATSQLEVVVFVDLNDNQAVDEDEVVNGLQVVVSLEDGSVISRKTENGTAAFDLTGQVVNSQATVQLPLLFRSQKVLIPENGVVPVLFKIEQADLPSVLP